MLTRRSFARLSGIAASSFLVGGLWGCGPGAGSDPDANGSTSDVPASDAAGDAGVGDSPSEPSAGAGPALAAGLVCVSEYAGNSIAVLDPAKGELAFRLACSTNPVNLATGADRLFVSCSGAGTVDSFALGDASRATSVQVGQQPLGMSFDAARGRLYVADYFSARVHIVDVALGSLVGSLDLRQVGFRNRKEPPPCCRRNVVGEGRRPVSLALSADGGTLYCCNYGTYDTARFDVASGEELDSFDGVVGPRKVLVSADQTSILVAGVGGEEEEREAELRVYDRTSGERMGGPLVGLGVSGVAQTADGGIVYALSADEGVLVALDAMTWQGLGNCSLAVGVDSLCLSPDGARIYAADSATGELWAVDAATLSVAWSAGGLASPKDVVVVP